MIKISVQASVLLVLVSSVFGEEPETKIDLDGIYTIPRTSIDKKGNEVKILPGHWTVLELSGSTFKHWFFSDRISKDNKSPVVGKFSRNGDIIELETEARYVFDKRFVATTINGVFGLWPEKQFKDLKKGKFSNQLPLLVRVADGPAGEVLDQDAFVFPDVMPLFDKAAAKKFWAEEERKYTVRFTKVPEPLRKLVRTRSDRNDHGMTGYKKLVADQQRELNKEIVQQLIAEIGKGISIVEGPMILNELYGHGILQSDPPLFNHNDVSKRSALQILVDAMGSAHNSHALSAVLMVFLRTAEMPGMDLVCSDGTRVKMSWRQDGYTHKSYQFSVLVRDECQRWAKEHLRTLYGAE